MTRRKAPSVINAAYARFLFWDGRAPPQFRDPITGDLVFRRRAALESQAVEPPLNSVEMAHRDLDWDGVEQRLTEVSPLALATNWPDDLVDGVTGKSYPDLFMDAFGSPEITPVGIAMASPIARWRRTAGSRGACG